jgi:ribosomal protein S5
MVQRQFALIPKEIDDQRKAWMQYVYRVSKVQHGGAYATLRYFLTIGDANACVKHMQDKAKPAPHWGATR